MFFFYGIRQSHLRTVPTPGHACPSCANTESLSLSFFGRYAHLFFVPLFGFSRTAVVVCEHCQFAGKGRDIPESLRPVAAQLKKGIGRPWWHFIGLLLVGLLALFIAFSLATSKPKAERDQEELGWLRQPKINDVIMVNIDSVSSDVGMLRVNKVLPDSVYVSPSKVAESTFKAYQHSSKPAYYQDISYPVAISELEQMHKDGRIHTVRREE